MIRNCIVAVALAIAAAGCAAGGGDTLRPLFDPASGGAPATIPCNASG
jgi:hypothetical protein